jgi:cytochrome c biogenesis protein ResB
VPDEYLQNSDAAIALPAIDAEPVAKELRRRHYRVSVTREGSATYVFADRYPWAQFATFVSHLALILFLAGGFVTVISAREQQVFAGEGEAPLPVFGINDPDHMQIYVEDAVGRFDATGFPLEFRTNLVIYRDGVEVARGPTTVSDPLSYGGYRFHQSAYFPDGAALTVRDVNTGRVVYDQVLALTATALTPRIVVRDTSGSVLLDDAIVPTDFISIGDAAGTTIQVPNTNRQFWVGARASDGDTGWQLIVFELGDASGTRAVLGEGQNLDLGGMTMNFVGMTNIPSGVLEDLPGLQGQGIVELSDGPSGKLLTVGPVSGTALALSPNEPVTVGGYEYTFAGQREFAGITVRRDPGSTFIWFGTGLLLLGLVLTFYTPRRRLWGKIEAGQAFFRGLGGRRLAVEKEIREVAARTGRV